MKKLFAVLLVITAFSCSKDDDNNSAPDPNAEVVFPDAALKAFLLDDSDIDTNLDGIITYAEAAAYTGKLDFSGNGGSPKYITNPNGLEAFVNINYLGLYLHPSTFSNFEFSNFKKIKTLVLYFNGDTDLKKIDLSGCESLENFTFNWYGKNSQLEEINLTSLDQLKEFRFETNGNLQIKHLDLSTNSALNYANINDNNMLETINLANGNNENLTLIPYFVNTTAMKCVKVDSETIAEEFNNKWEQYSGRPIFFTSCSN